MITCSHYGISVSNPTYYLTLKINALKKFYATQTKKVYCSALCNRLPANELPVTSKLIIQEPRDDRLNAVSNAPAFSNRRRH
jgi:hypothetical protein